MAAHTGPRATTVHLARGRRVTVVLSAPGSVGELVARTRSGRSQVAAALRERGGDLVAELTLPGGARVWDLYVRAGEEQELQRVLDGRLERVDRWVTAGAGLVLQAFRTKDDGLALRVVERRSAADLRRLKVRRDALVLRVRLRDAAQRGEGQLVATPRGGAAPVVVPAAVRGRAVRARLPLRALSGNGIWDLHVQVRSRDGADALRLAAGPATGLAERGTLAVHQRERVRDSVAVEVFTTPDAKVSVSCRVAPGPDPAPTAPPAVVRRLAVAWSARAEARATAARRAAAPPPGPRPRVYFYMRSAYAMSGIASTVLTTARHLVDAGYPVEIISLFRPRDHPFFPIDPRIPVTVVFDERPSSDGWSRGRTRLLRALHRWHSVLTDPSEGTFPRSSLATDLLTVQALQRLGPGILVGTRPALNVHAARFAPAGVRVLGQEHMSFTTHSPRRLAWLLPHYAKLDALALLTEDDVRDVAGLPGGAPTRLLRIPNGLPRLPEEVADPAAKVVVSAGRLTRQKGYDLLIPAFAQVLEAHPDWELRIFGSGREQDDLQRRIDELGVGHAVRLMGRTRQMNVELARASVYALSSRYEGFPMVLVEAMGVGLPAVAFDCPRGPADLVAHGTTGLLAPPGDVPALAAALAAVMASEELRRSMSQAARRAALDYCFDAALGQRWEDALDGLVREDPSGR